MSDIKYAKNGDVEIAYEVFGNPATGKPLLLIMGLDMQMVWWPTALIEQAVDRGYCVVRFDNRDAGLSTKFDSQRKENAFKALLGGSKPQYTGLDMVNDGIAVMDAIGWESANVLGASMGAALAQGMAVQYPDRVRSLISVSGLPADSSKLAMMKYLKYGWYPKMAKVGNPTDRDSEIEVMSKIMKLMANGGDEAPEGWVRETAGTSYDRSPRDSNSTQRQLAAGNAWKVPPINTIQVPTLIVAGEVDPMIKTSAATATANKIPNSRLVIYPKMGHLLSPELVPAFLDEVDTVTS